MEKIKYDLIDEICEKQDFDELLLKILTSNKKNRINKILQDIDENENFDDELKKNLYKEIFNYVEDANNLLKDNLKDVFSIAVKTTITKMNNEIIGGNVKMSRKIKVTIADDNIHICKFIKEYLEKYNDVEILGVANTDEDEMWMIEKLIKEQPNDANIGLPLGNQSSQWFALLYLNVIDRFVKEVLKIKGYIRYMDDMILIHRDKKYLQYCLKEIENKCTTELKLSLNKKTQIGIVKNGIDFLGYRHILNENGSITRKLRASSKQRLKRHLKTLKKLRDKKIVDDDYVYIRKNAFYNHIKDTKESKKLKVDSFPKKV